ncbi:phosphotransferase family protein [Geodermatophilus sp. SYSU D00779]
MSTGGGDAGPAAARAARALRTHAPELADLPLRELGRGLDNTAFAAGELVLRVADGHDVQREAGLLGVLAPRLPLAVPVPVFADADAGVLGHRLLPGRPLLGRAPAPGTAAVLGRFLRDLHATDPDTVRAFVDEDDADPAEWLADLDGPPELLRVVRSSVPRRSTLRVVAHADLGAEHLLADGPGLTGVIDWSDCAITDPALDFARLHRDFGPAFLAETLQAYGGLPDAGPRIEFFARCAALEDLGYGLRTGRAEYAAAARRSLAWLFPA